ncbi:MAG: hypothetical protein WCK34_14390 [Bacteroidota bacterium]
MENSKRWQRAELLIFTTVTILNLLPFVATRFFPSMDGASHLANSNIISQLIFHHNAAFSRFFMINPEPVPNWTAHLAISIMTLVMPAFLAEKILILVILTGIPFAFRSLIQTISPKNHLFSFLIFPFTHSMFFFFGFFNFCMAVLFFLVALNYWLRNGNGPWNAKKILSVVLLVYLTYLSHIVVFGLMLILVSLHIITEAIALLICKKSDLKSILASFLKKTAVISVAAIVPLLLFVYFFYSRPGTRDITFIPRKVLFDFLVTVRPLISFNQVTEGKITTLIFYLLLLVIATGLGFFVFRLFRGLFTRQKEMKYTGMPMLPATAFWWLLASMAVILALYFTLPDAYGTASYTNLRIGFIFFLVAFLWISTFRIPWWIGLAAAMAGCLVNTVLIRIYTPGIIDLNKLAVSCNKAADFVPPNSLVLPVYCMDNWFTGHFVDYIAVDKPLVMINNYECVSGYFPVKWNDKSKPDSYLGDPAKPGSYMNFGITPGHAVSRVDYVFVVGQIDPSKDWFSSLYKILKEDFVAVYVTESCSLYKYKPGRLE